MFTFEIDLNGGDSQSDNADLIFKIYDSGVLHHTTGSVNSDADVSISGDVVTILNVPSVSGQSYVFTVSVVDEAGNESAISNSISVTASSGTLIYQNDFTSGLNGIAAGSNTTLSLVSNELRIEATSGGVADKFFSLANSNFIAPDNANFVDGTTYAFEIDISSLNLVTTANNNYPAPEQTEKTVLASTTLRWERNDMSNGSFQLEFGIDGGGAWTGVEFVQISELRVYKL